MSIAHLLEDFEISSPVSSLARHLSDEALEEERLTAFENGYSAGWEDAVQAQTQDKSRLDEALCKTLEDQSFTYHEALAHMSLSLEPMFESLVSTVLPDTIDLGFSQRLTEELQKMAMQQMAQPAMLVVPPGMSETLNPILAREFSIPVQLIEEPSMEKNQASLRVGVAEQEVDCSHLLPAIADALEAFLNQSKEKRQNA